MLFAYLTLIFISFLKESFANNLNQPNYLNKIISKDWDNHFNENLKRKFQVIAGPGMEELASNIMKSCPERFLYHATKWDKFPDGTDKIEIGGFQPFNRIAGQDILFLCSFHSNDVTLSQFSVMITLLQSFIRSLTVVLPFYPVGTMERVIREGQVATANSYAQMFSNLPSCGCPTRLLTYDLHTLQNRFYLHNHAFASLQTTIPLLIGQINQIETKDYKIDCIAFPDDGAAKRFSDMFMESDYEIVTCGKIRHGQKRIVNIQDGNPKNKNIVIVDDLIQTGGTLYECGLALRAAGANTVNAFVAHAVFPDDSWKRFIEGGDRACFDRFFITNSCPTVVKKLKESKTAIFTILDLTQKIIEDLDNFTN